MITVDAIKSQYFKQLYPKNINEKSQVTKKVSSQRIESVCAKLTSLELKDLIPRSAHQSPHMSVGV